MESKLEWLSEDEGRITFYEDGERFLTAQVYRFGDEEAEIRLQDVVFLEKQQKNDNMSEKIIQKMTDCVSETFRILEEEGLTETTLVERLGTRMAEMLDSTRVVSVAYKEYMMKSTIPRQKTTGCGLPFLFLTKTEDGYNCRNKENTFFCRLLNYQENRQGEHAYYLYEVEVNKKARNKGVATVCLTELFSRLSAEMPVTVYLQVGSYNEPAVHLYKKLGFEICEELRCYVMTD